MSREAKRVLVYRLGSLGDTVVSGVHQALNTVSLYTSIIVASFGIENQANVWKAIIGLRLFGQLKYAVRYGIRFYSKGVFIGLRIVDVKGHA